MSAAILPEPAQLRRVGVAAAVAAATFWIAFDGGSYAATSRGALAIAVWWVLAVAVSLSLWPRTPVPTAALVTGGVLAAFVIWIGLSALWDESAERTVTELNRATLYLGVFALAVCAVDRVRLMPALTGLGAALTAIGVLALGSRLFPDLVDASGQLAQIFPAAEKRLSYPVNYWNGLATLTAFALPLLLYLATSVRQPALRGLSLAPLPALAGTIYLTSSRGGSAAAVVAIASFLVCSGRRWAAAAAVGLAGAAAAVVVAVLAARSELVDNPIASDLAVDQGRSAAVLIALACLATGGIWALGSLFAPAPPKLPVAVRVAFVVALVGLIGVGVAAANPRERFDRFKEIPPGLGEASVQEHLLSGSGNGRWQLWEAAYDEFKRHPVEGRGAGTYEATWAEHGTLPLFVRDAHSLYFETLAELGLVGLLLLIGALVAGSAAAVSRMLKTVGDDRSALAALSAVVAAFAIEAAFDWMWELTAVAVVAFAALGLLAGPATTAAGDRSPARATLLRAAAFAAAFAVLLAQSVSLLADLRIRESRTAAERTDYPEAVADAQAARSLAPWFASPRLQLALAQELAGDVAAARESVQEAAARDPIDWRIWLVAARIETKAGDFRGAAESLRRAQELNPRSELFTSE